MDYVTRDIQKPAPWFILYADDVALIADFLAEVQKDVTLWQEFLERRGLKVSRQKTEYMYCNFSGKNSPRDIPYPSRTGKNLKRVEEFKYLGSNIKG